MAQFCCIFLTRVPTPTSAHQSLLEMPLTRQHHSLNRAQLPLQEGQSNYLHEVPPSPDSLHSAPAFLDIFHVLPRQKSHLPEPVDKT